MLKKVYYGILMTRAICGACFVLLVSNESIGQIIENCGTYSVQGYYTEIPSLNSKGAKQPVILIERDSQSEIKFVVTNLDKDTKLAKKDSRIGRIQDLVVGLNYNFKIKFITACWYHCEGEIVEIGEVLDQGIEPEPFLFPYPRPLAGTNIKCHTKPSRNSAHD